MAFDTDGSDLGTDEKEPVGRSMRNVAGAAPFHFYRWMLKNPGASLFRVAFEAEIHAEDKPAPRSQAGPRPGPMRGMTVRALHRPFQHFVPGRKVEFGLDVLVAGET